MSEETMVKCADCRFVSLESDVRPDAACFFLTESHNSFPWAYSFKSDTERSEIIYTMRFRIADRYALHPCPCFEPKKTPKPAPDPSLLEIEKATLRTFEDALLYAQNAGDPGRTTSIYRRLINNLKMDIFWLKQEEAQARTCHYPVFLRTAEGEIPTPEQLLRLADLIREDATPRNEEAK